MNTGLNQTSSQQEINAAKYQSEASDRAQAMLTISTKVLEYSTTAFELGKLSERFANLAFPVHTSTGMKEAVTARAELRNLRVGLEKMRVSIKSPALERCRLIDAEAKEITAKIEALEKPIDQQIKVEEDRKEREKLDRERIEAERVAVIRARVDAIRHIPIGLSGCAALEIASELEALRAFRADDTFAELAADADAAAQLTINALSIMHERQVEHEAELAKANAEREELSRLRAEEQARAAKAAEEQAARAHQAALERAAQAEIERLAAVEREVIAQAERQANAKAAEALLAERAQLDLERRDFEQRMAEAAREQEQEPEPTEQEKNQAATDLVNLVAGMPTPEYVAISFADREAGVWTMPATTAEQLGITIGTDLSAGPDSTDFFDPQAQRLIDDSENITLFKLTVRDLLKTRSAEYITQLLADELASAS